MFRSALPRALAFVHCIHPTVDGDPTLQLGVLASLREKFLLAPAWVALDARLLASVAFVATASNGPTPQEIRSAPTSSKVVVKPGRVPL